MKADTKFNRMLCTFNKQKYIQFMVLPWIIWLIIFAYAPMYGIIIAFKEMHVNLGIAGSPWVGLKQFRILFTDPQFIPILKNTLFISGYKLLFGFPAPLIFALLLNELPDGTYKKTVQSVSYLPHFISWVIVSGMIIRMLSSQGGLINDIFVALKIIDEPIGFMGEPGCFYSIAVISDIWKNIGYSAILYIAAISGIDQELYDAATIDGAGRFKKIINITLPCISSTVIVLLIFRISGILNAGFDEVYLLQNSMNIETAEILDTYVFKKGISQSRYSYATAVSLFKSVIGVILVCGANFVSKKLTDQGLW